MSARYAVLPSSTAGDRLAARTILAEEQLSDGTLIFLVWDFDEPGLKLYYAAGSPRTTATLIDAPPMSNAINSDGRNRGFWSGAAPYSTPTALFSLCRDQWDNIYVVGLGDGLGNNPSPVGGVPNVGGVAYYEKGDGYAWTRHPRIGSLRGIQGIADEWGYHIGAARAAWVAGGPGSGYLIVMTGMGGGYAYTIDNVRATTDANVEGNWTDNFNAGNPIGTFDELSVDMAQDFYGSAAMMFAFRSATHTISAMPMGFDVASGHWVLLHGGLPHALTMGNPGFRVRILPTGVAQRYVVVSRASGTNQLVAALVETGSILVAPTATGTPTGWIDPAAVAWDAYSETVTWKVHVLELGSTSTTILRLSLAIDHIAATMAWAGASESIDGAFGTGTNSTLVAVPSPTEGVAIVEDFLVSNNDGAGTLQALGGTLSLDQAPYAPIPLFPKYGKSVDLAAGQTFTWKHKDPNAGDTQSAFHFRRRLAGSTTWELWNPTTQLWQTTEDASTDNVTATMALPFPPGAWADLNTNYFWAVRTRDTKGGWGPWCADVAVTGVAAPTIAMVAPSGSVTDTDEPTAVHTYAQSDANPQRSRQYRVFTAAQYGIGGFHAATSPATWDSGEIFDQELSQQIPVRLVNGVYRVYGRVSTTGAVYSTWQFIGWTQAATPPAAPTLAAVADATLARVALTITGHDSGTWGLGGTEAIEAQRSRDGGTTWEPVRLWPGAGPATTAPVALPHPGDVLTAYDYEAPRRVSLRYRVREIATIGGNSIASAYSAATAALTLDLVDCGDARLKAPFDPTLNMVFPIGSSSPPALVGREAELQTEVALLGRTDVVVMHDIIGAERLPGVPVAFLSDASWKAFRALRALRAPLLLQTPYGDSAAEQFWVTVGAVVEYARAASQRNLQAQLRTASIEFIPQRAPA